MKVNVGLGDKVARIIVGVGIILAGLIFKSWWGIVGIVPLATAVTGFCPLYTLLGVSTCKVKPAVGGPA